MMRVIVAFVLLAGATGLARADAEYSVRWLPQSVERATSETPAVLASLGEMDPSDAGEISASRAALYSLLLPGLGDYKAGNKSRAYVFFGVDAALWTALIVSEVQGKQRQDAYEEYAVLFAGVSRTGHSDEYYAVLREYDNSELYEADIKAQGRAELWPGNNPSGQDPDVGYVRLQTYFEQNRVQDYEEWEWRSIDNKVQFQETRSASKNAYRRSDYAIAALAANRIVAAIFAYTGVRRSDKDSNEQARRYQIDFTLPRPEYEASVTLIRRF